MISRPTKPFLQLLLLCYLQCLIEHSCWVCEVLHCDTHTHTHRIFAVTNEKRFDEARSVQTELLVGFMASTVEVQRC